jgi:hypothetical protein
MNYTTCNIDKEIDEYSFRKDVGKYRNQFVTRRRDEP